MLLNLMSHGPQEQPQIFTNNVIQNVVQEEMTDEHSTSNFFNKNRWRPSDVNSAIVYVVQNGDKEGDDADESLRNITHTIFEKG